VQQIHFAIRQKIYFNLSVTFYYNNEYPYVELLCLASILRDIMLSIIMLSIVTLDVVKLSFNMLSAVNRLS
jgi:hypothetical protein